MFTISYLSVEKPKFDYYIVHRQMLLVCFSESQLEEVLTVYTRLSRSSSVFLNTGSRPSSALGTAATKSDASAKPKKVSERDREEKDAAADVSVKHGKLEKHDPDDGRKFYRVLNVSSINSFTHG